MEQINQTDINHKNIAYKTNFSKVKNYRKTIVFLNGFLSDMEGTKSQYMEQFCTENNLGYLAFDYSGHGQSSGDAKDGSISEWLEESVHVIDSIAKTPVILIGSSMGGWIALLSAITLKEKVSGIVTIACAADFTEELIWSQLDKKQQEILMKEGQIILPRGGYDYCFTKKLIEDGKKNLLLKKEIPINAPIILLHGTNDESVPVEISRKVMDKVISEDVKLVIVKNADHRMSSEPDLKLLSDSVISLV